MNVVSTCTDWESLGISAFSGGDNTAAGEMEMKAVAEAIVSNGNRLKLWHIYDSSHSSSCTLQL